MRKITSHIVNGDSANHQLEITVTDEPGAGGANHVYVVSYVQGGMQYNTVIHFQDGPIREVGVNGITGEALLAIEIDRLASFQNGPYACQENARALNCCQDALRILQERTRRRIVQGVEGTHAKDIEELEPKTAPQSTAGFLE